MWGGLTRRTTVGRNARTRHGAAHPTPPPRTAAARRHRACAGHGTPHTVASHERVPRMTFGDPRTLLREMFGAAVDAATPARVLKPHLPPPPKGRTVVVGAGKAAAAMAEAVEQAWSGALTGQVVTRYGHAVPC